MGQLATVEIATASDPHQLCIMRSLLDLPMTSLPSLSIESRVKLDRILCQTIYPKFLSHLLRHSDS